MRLPIVDFPKIVSENVGQFASIFSTLEQKKHFCEYVTGLIAGDEATIASINALYLNKNDQSSLNKFVTQAKWDEVELNRKRIALELSRLNCRPVSKNAGRLIIDDTMAHHTRCAMEGLAYLYDHTVSHNVWCHNVVTSYYVNRSDQFPVNFRLYLQFRKRWERAKLQQLNQAFRTSPTEESLRSYLAALISYEYRQRPFRTKTELAAELVRDAIDCHLPFALVLFDSWYLRWPLISEIQRVKKDWIGACPNDRRVLVNNGLTRIDKYIQTIPTEAYHPYRVGSHLFWAFTKVLPMKALNNQKVRIVASYEDRVNLTKIPNFYVTNRKDWEPKRILTSYCDRWPTETFNQDAKAHLGFEDYQLHRLHGIRRHWYLSFVAYSLLGDKGPHGRSRWQVKGRFESTGQRCRSVVDELLSYLIEWIVQQNDSGVATDTIIHTLLA